MIDGHVGEFAASGVISRDGVPERVYFVDAIRFGPWPRAEAFVRELCA